MKRRNLSFLVTGLLVATMLAPSGASAAPRGAPWSVTGVAWVDVSSDGVTRWRETKPHFNPTGTPYGATGSIYVKVTETGAGWWTRVSVAYARKLTDGRVLVTGPTVAAGGTAAGYTSWQYYHLVFDGRRAVVVSGGAEPGGEATARSWIETAYDPFNYPPFPFVGPGSWLIDHGSVRLHEFR